MLNQQTNDLSAPIIFIFYFLFAHAISLVNLAQTNSEIRHVMRIQFVNREICRALCFPEQCL